MHIKINSSASKVIYHSCWTCAILQTCIHHYFTPM